jgi:hypothetical protein
MDRCIVGKLNVRRKVFSFISCLFVFDTNRCTCVIPYKIKSGSLFIETHREQYYINLLSILLKCSPLPIEILTAVGESFVTVTMISMNCNILLSYFFYFFSGFHEFGISLFAGLVDVEPKEAAMLPCIIAHHPCPHPPQGWWAIMRGAVNSLRILQRQQEKIEKIIRFFSLQIINRMDH